jgi:hypothetical protein
MKFSILGVAAVLIGAAATAVSADPLTELEKFHNKVKTYAAPSADIFDKPKGLCACISDPGNADNNGAAGVLDSAVISVPDAVPQRIRVRCMVIKATSLGNVTQAESCENFVPLAK